MTHVTCRLTAKNRDQLRNSTLGNRVRATFTFFYDSVWCRKNCNHDRSHCESSLGSSDECRLSAGWPPTLRPSQSTWAVSPPKIDSYCPHPPSPVLLLLSPYISWYSFYRPTKGGRLSRPKHCSKGAQRMPKAVYRSICRDKHNCSRRRQRSSVIHHL